ncbi:hypothetical protein [Hippea alviniae]|uniref:hypothetical protein n=1 Tax=Hippea alviniae TaxID=1279027 RepID=UPI0003B6A945|nr:hypothetical protein [Hippea alviniae]
MATFLPHNHQCATCEFWDGQRKVSTDRKEVIVEPSGFYGKCMVNPKITPPKKPAGGSCSKWQKWGFLA